MIINQNDIQRIRDFVLTKPTTDEVKLCSICHLKEDINCKVKDICLKYSPLVLNDETTQLIEDLLDTIDDFERKLNVREKR